MYKPYGDAIVPESYKVDLTGFCMPTTHTKITDVFGYRPRRRRMHYGLMLKYSSVIRFELLSMVKYA